MRLRARTFEQFGRYLLLRKIESDAFCETWRSRTESSTSEFEFLAIRRFPSIDHAAFAETAARASRVLEGLSGPSIARRQRVETIDREAVLVHEYEGGRTLAHVIDRSRNSASGRTPLPEDLALTIMERLLLALVATHEYRSEGMQTVHGGLVPQFVWLTADGEVRLAGQELGRAVLLLQILWSYGLYGHVDVGGSGAGVVRRAADEPRELSRRGDAPRAASPRRGGCGAVVAARRSADRLGGAAVAARPG